ncbi:hypothetical protein BSKO_05836 [Bryopsis sp. KO-2023]|nr:hypothetical protein BSKO_05836 [Bryopsis sp. KO-2023]
MVLEQGTVVCQGHKDDDEDECKPGMSLAETSPKHSQPILGMPIRLLQIQVAVDVLHDRYPYLVSLQRAFSDQTFCVGVLIRKDLVLTSASCFSTGDLVPNLHIGTTNIRDAGEGEKRTACRVMIHKNFQDDKIFLGYDIALIQLDQDSTIEPVKLDRDAGTPPAEHPITMGWYLNENRFNPQHLQHVSMDTIPPSECSEKLDAFLPDLDTNLSDQMDMDKLVCVEFDGQQCREGDGGAPLIKPGDGCGENDVLLGMLSFGPQCQSPDIYTRITKMSLKNSDEQTLPLYLFSNVMHLLTILQSKSLE